MSLEADDLDRPAEPVVPVDPPHAVFNLPGEWWRLPVDGTVADAMAAAEALLDHVFPHKDELARPRHEARQQLRRAVDLAVPSTVVQLWLALRLAGPVPLPVTLSVSWIEPVVDLLGDADVRGALLTAALAESGPGTAVQLTSGSRAVGRLVRASSADGLAESELRVTYWMSTEPGAPLLVFSFATPMARLAEQFVELFDVVISSVEVVPADSGRP